MELFLNFLNEADTSATTFFHEVICGIACADPVGALKIKTGEDVKKYFDNGTIKAVKGSGASGALSGNDALTSPGLTSGVTGRSSRCSR